MDDLLGLRAGKLRTYTLSSTAATIVPQAILEFRDRLPDVELSVSILEPPVPDMVARNASADVRICAVQGVRLTRPIVAVMPAGYQSGAARAMLEILRQVSARWQAAGRSLRPLARTG